VGEELQICPYYLTFELLPLADVVIGDYHHVSSPSASLPESLVSPLPPTLLIDEAHNLFERALEDYSPQLDLKLLAHLSPPLGLTNHPVLMADWQRLYQDLEAWCLRPHSRKAEAAEVRLDGESLQVLRRRFLDLILAWLQEGLVFGEGEPVLQFFFQLHQLAEQLAAAGDETKACFLPSERGDFLGLVCCDAGRWLRERWSLFHSVVAFSATLKPFAFYGQLSGLGPEASAWEFASPFPPENRQVLLMPQVSTAWRHRQNHYQGIAGWIHALARLAQGHYFVFVPSYDFSRQLLPYLQAALPDFLIGCQEMGMSPARIDELLAGLQQVQPSRLILGVQGGALSEGLDCHAEALRGVFVVGPALPALSFARRLRAEYYQNTFGDGFGYAYIYPAMSRSIQAAGRVIRSEAKRGLIVLMDQRFCQATYTRTMPMDWFRGENVELCPRDPVARVTEFWQQQSCQRGRDPSRMIKN
jgi:DNA excision repair protein ERCC-2